MTEAGATWNRALVALACLSRDPELGGMVIRARPGPVRERLIAEIEDLLPRVRRIHPNIADDQLFGGVDITATLASGKVVHSRGILADEQTLLLTMAERTQPGLAARLSQHLDSKPGSLLILIDEGSTPDEQVPACLAERVAFHIDLTDVSIAESAAARSGQPKPLTHSAKREKPNEHTKPLTRSGACDGEDAAASLVALASRFGIDSLRAPLFALSCARAHASLHGRATPGADDVRAAAELVFPHRATLLPQEEEHAQTTPEEAETSDSQPDNNDTPASLPSGDMLVDVVAALLPRSLLDQLKAKPGNKNAAGAGSGDKHKGNRRGRPLPPRSGRPDGRARIDLAATLRAAAPWQPIRRRARPDAPGLLIRGSDLRLRRFEEKSDRLLIFAVDASGSSAISRLNEAKGAVELLLAEAYARRDHVALVAFRGTGAELLLPPTRSLVQTKRRLAALPGGGGTPLAAGLKEAAELATVSKTKGLTPTVVVMTDGRANIALDGSADRPRAAADCETLANAMCSQRIPGLMIDTGNRPQPQLQILADMLDAPYLPLPRADAQRVSAAVSGALGAT